MSIKRKFTSMPIPSHFDDDAAVLAAFKKAIPEAVVTLDFFETCEGCLSVFVDRADGTEIVEISPHYMDEDGNEVAIDEVRRCWVLSPDEDEDLMYELTSEKPIIGYSVIDQIKNEHIADHVSLEDAVKTAVNVFNEHQPKEGDGSHRFNPNR